MGLEQSLVMGVGLAYLFSRMLKESEARTGARSALEDRAAGLPTERPRRLRWSRDPRRGPSRDHDVGAERDVALDRQPLRADQ